MDLFSGCWTIYTFSRLGAKRGKRVRHLEPMKYRDCTKGKCQSSGNQVKEKSVSAGQATQLPQWAIEETAWRLLLPLRGLFEYFSGNPWPLTASLSSKHKILCDQLGFVMALCYFLILCLLGTKHNSFGFVADVIVAAATVADLFGWVFFLFSSLQWWWWKVNITWTSHVPKLGFNMRNWCVNQCCYLMWFLSKCS